MGAWYHGVLSVTHARREGHGGPSISVGNVYKCLPPTNDVVDNIQLAGQNGNVQYLAPRYPLHLSLHLSVQGT